MVMTTARIIDFKAARTKQAILRRRAELATTRQSLFGRAFFNPYGVFVPATPADFSGFSPRTPATVTALRADREHCQGA